MGDYITSIFSKRLGSIRWKNAPQPAKWNIGTHPLNVKISWHPNIVMWGVYPEAMACNVGGLCSDFNLGERILRKSTQRPNLKVLFEFRPLGLYIQICSPKSKSDHNPPTLQAIAPGWTPHMPMFGRHHFFYFRKWLTNIWLCWLRGVFSMNWPNSFGKVA